MASKEKQLKMDREKFVMDNLKFTFKNPELIGGLIVSGNTMTFHDKRFGRKYEIIINEL